MIHRQPDRKFDLRTLERYLDKGKITKQEYDSYVAALQDAQELSAEFQAQFVEGILEQKASKARHTPARHSVVDFDEDPDYDDLEDDDDDDLEDEDEDDDDED